MFVRINFMKLVYLNALLVMLVVKNVRTVLINVTSVMLNLKKMIKVNVYQNVVNI